MRNFQELGIEESPKGFIGNKIEVDDLLNKSIIVHRFEIRPSKYDKGTGKCLYMQIEVDEKNRVVFTGSRRLMETIQKINESDFPFKTTIIKKDKSFLFS